MTVSVPAGSSPGLSWKKRIEPPLANGLQPAKEVHQAEERTLPAVSGGELVAAQPTQAVAPTLQAASHTADPKHSGEDFLMEMLAGMDQHMQHLRKTQQGLVAIIEASCRRALEHHFGRLMLVGSAALRVETPGSDIDVVCFTRRDQPEAAGLPAEVLRRVHWALRELLGELISQYSDYASSFSTELIDDARVPILKVIWGPAENPVAVDVSVDQSRPVDHVRWFQRVGAAPRPTAPPPVVAPLVTLTLRCVKWWLRQRQIPRTKEGGLPTLAWLLMVVHVCSLPETHEQAIVSGQRPMAALLASLTAFFQYYADLERLDGILRFAVDGSSSEFKRRAAGRAGPWAELVVLDPTREGHESLNLVPRLPPATQLLLAHELRRAGQRLEQVPRGCESSFGESRRTLEEVFEPLLEGTNVMPSFLVGEVGVLLLCAQASAAGDVRNVEFGVVDYVLPRPGWAAPFLHRGDDRSELRARLCDVDEASGQCAPRPKDAAVAVSPCDFICCARLEREGRRWRLDPEGLERLRAMRGYLAAVSGGGAQQRRGGGLGEAPGEKPAAAAAQGLGSIPSPARSRHGRADA